ncbi:MAG: DNA mismatch repair protein MutS [Deltaproteobacteria bacterium]|nr:DNA mismatch repair protein MutS [Deltaproteobacteria bacterium]
MDESLKITPMLRQYLEIKEQHQDAILFYRLGDFYEMFFDDAVTASRVLGITLTSRSGKDDANRVPLCGVPYHAASSYLAKLVNNGFRVAICEQVEDPKEAKGVVRREVVRVISPGVVTEEQILDEKSNRYVAALFYREKWGVSLLDLSTGEFLAAEYPQPAELIDELLRLTPAELLIADEQEEAMGEIFDQVQTICLTRRPFSHFHRENARETLLDHFRTTSLAGFGCDHLQEGVCAAGALLQYIRETQKTDLSHIERLMVMDRDNVLLIDESSRRNLELTRTIIGAEREGSLLATIDLTRTPMGARLLRKNLLFPLQDVAEINRRLDTVGFLAGEKNHAAPPLAPAPAEAAGTALVTGEGLRAKLREILAGVYDLERLNSRVVLGSANGRDLTALRQSLALLPELRLLTSLTRGILCEESRDLDLLPDIHELLAGSIRDDCPITLREGGLIQPGFDSGLDELVSLLTDGKKHILALEEMERQRTGIAKLKISYNRVFGYFIEVSRGQLANVPPDFIRKQTLVNAERFITPELKEFESKVLGAEEKRVELEYQLFCRIRAQVAAASSRIIRAAAFIARVDFFAGLAEAARRYHYVRPQVDAGEEIFIREGRHPVIERSLPAGRFVPNDIRLDQNEQEVLIVTGPNMAGKSTVLRQTALIVLMAQMGGFVPAAEAHIGIVDRIFTRVGAMDDLRRGQSTFMVEMNETANILNNATERSLVVLDEIGRGTSTFDGLAIAWAVTEDLVQKNGRGVKTIFATHYHELTELALTHSRVKNFNIAVREWDDSIIFLHKLLPGGTSKSYGIQVAALAGVPKRVVARARELLHNIEKGKLNSDGRTRIAPGKKARPKHPNQLNLFAPAENPLRKKINEINPDLLTPLEALHLLYELKNDA